MKKLHYIILACISNTLFRFQPFDFSFGELSENHSSYAVGQALSYILLIKCTSGIWKTRAEIILYDIVIWCAISNLADELFFNPLSLGLNELLFAFFIITWTTVKQWKTRALT